MAKRTGYQTPGGKPQGYTGSLGQERFVKLEFADRLETHVKQALGQGECGVAEIRPGLRTGKGGSGHSGILGER